MYNYPKPPPSVSSGFAVEKGGPRQEGAWYKGRAVRTISVCPCLPLAAFPWLDPSSPGCEHVFQGPGVQKVTFPALTFPINQAALAVETTIKQSSLFAEIRFSKMPTAEQGPFTMSAPEEGCVINLELM